METDDLNLLSAAQALEIRNSFSTIAEDYLIVLTTVGYGQHPNGRFVYSGPIYPGEIYGETVNERNIVLLGDDGLGYCFGYDLENKTYGEFTPEGQWEPHSIEKVFRDFLN